MRRIFCLILALLLLFSTSSSSYAQVWPIKSKYFAASLITNYIDDSDIKAGVLIYGIKCIAKGDKAQVAIFDAITVANCTTTNLVDEDGAASQGDVTFSPLPEPIKLVTGCSVVVCGGDAIVYYRP